MLQLGLRALLFKKEENVRPWLWHRTTSTEEVQAETPGRRHIRRVGVRGWGSGSKGGELTWSHHLRTFCGPDCADHLCGLSLR